MLGLWKKQKELDEIKKIDTGYVLEIYYALLQKMIRIYPYVKDEETYNFLNEKTTIEVELWNYYLIIANMLGISDRVINELKVFYPEVNLDISYIDDIINFKKHTIASNIDIILNE